MPLSFIDFEYNNPQEPNPNLVSYADLNEKVWLHNQGYKYLKEKLEEKKGTTIVSYNATAEARCFIALGLNPLDFKWIDLYLEYRCLTNHNKYLMYGRQLFNGKVKKTVPPPKNKFDMTEEELDRMNNQKPEHNYAAACYKLLGVFVDTERKDRVRDLIISSPEFFSEEEKEEILEYNQSDVVHLPEMLKATLSWYKKLLGNKYDKKELISEMHWRGEYAARTAWMEHIGYPINVEKTYNFSLSVDKILWRVQNEINELFPEIKPFELGRDYRFVWKQKRTRDWIQKQGFRSWMMTEPSKTHPKGQLSLKLEAWERYFNFSHDYPKDNFGAQMVRYLKLNQQLRGFSPTAKKSFWDYVGSDGRARPFFGIYGSQSSRSQPKATGFLFLKSAWMRALCEPRPGRAMGTIDYGQQEFYIQALEANDKVMMDAYLSGDPYLYQAKAMKAVPDNATKKSHPLEREKFKATTLALQFGQTKYGLSTKLTQDTGIKHNKEQAQGFIDAYHSLFKKVGPYTEKLLQKYQSKRFLKLADGWYLWGDNPNHRSVTNVPMQGGGAVVMRLAVKYAQERGLDVVMTLHDALYIEFDVGEEKEAMKTLAQCMQDAFLYYYPYAPGPIKVDGSIWSPDYEDGEIEVEGLSDCKKQKIYIDERGAREYEKFKKFFNEIEVPEDL